MKPSSLSRQHNDVPYPMKTSLIDQYCLQLVSDIMPLWFMLFALHVGQ